MAVNPAVLEPTAVAGALCAEALTATQKKKLHIFRNLLDGDKQFGDTGKNFTLIKVSVALGLS